MDEKGEKNFLVLEGAVTFLGQCLLNFQHIRLLEKSALAEKQNKTNFLPLLVGDILLRNSKDNVGKKARGTAFRCTQVLEEFFGHHRF